MQHNIAFYRSFGCLLLYIFLVLFPFECGSVWPLWPAHTSFLHWSAVSGAVVMPVLFIKETGECPWCNMDAAVGCHEPIYYTVCADQCPTWQHHWLVNNCQAQRTQVLPGSLDYWNWQGFGYQCSEKPVCVRRVVSYPDPLATAAGAVMRSSDVIHLQLHYKTMEETIAQMTLVRTFVSRLACEWDLGWWFWMIYLSMIRKTVQIDVHV